MILYIYRLGSIEVRKITNNAMGTNEMVRY